jgi:hypothetical protein
VLKAGSITVGPEESDATGLARHAKGFEPF